MRSYNRFIVDQEIECDIAGERDVVMLYNLSSGGCMIETRSGNLSEGSAVEVRLRELATMPGRIVWRIGRNAGIKFEVPLHQKVVEHFGFSAPDEDFDSNDPRDRFGIPILG
ncbi:PilZ domain-containing protein [Altererythrobacter sp. SALINAS58]|uniref:PilZ domain-containing protein n=1 Tax=Alteripontixanthobacter muriae TaxID=2705546 RepID=UPI00157661D0|nr:PilZ domain-containing protein [Alteripontixanthobacter muriae]NTZ42368.1 PilZ domain-containing protein [Alteripontixanthobacter muriae]